MKGPNNLRSMAKLGVKNPDYDSLDEDMEKPVYKLVKSIDDKKTISVKKSPADIKRLLDEEDRRRHEQGSVDNLRVHKPIKA